MSYALAQSRSAAASTLAYSGAVTAASLLVCIIRESGATITAVSDSVNGAWTKAFNIPTLDTTDDVCIWYRVNTGAGTPTVSPTGGASTRRILIMEYTGASALTSLYDADGTIDNGTPTTWTGPAVDAPANSLIVVGLGLGSTRTVTVTSPFTEQVDVGNTLKIWLGDYQNAPASSYTPSGAMGGGSSTVACVAAVFYEVTVQDAPQVNNTASRPRAPAVHSGSW